MTKTFNSLDITKQKRILNAALKEFAEKGFKQASTNKIVKEASIGKGMLFYYFKKKQDLYFYLIDYAVTTMISDFFGRINKQESDFIERLKQIAKVKLHYYDENPNISNFLATVYLNDEVELPDRLKKRLAEAVEEGNMIMFENVDKTLLRNDVDPDKVFHIIRWSIDGYQNEIMQLFKGTKIAHIDLEPYWEDFYGYLDILKTAFYKNGGI